MFRIENLGGAKIHPPQNLVARIISFFGVANDRLTGIYRHNALNASPFEIISADGAFFGFCRIIAASVCHQPFSVYIIRHLTTKAFRITGRSNNI